MNATRLKKEFLPRYQKVEDECERKLKAIRAEIRKQYGWDGKFVQITLEHFGQQKYRVDLCDMESDQLAGDVTVQPIGKEAAQLLIEMGFPSGS